MKLASKPRKQASQEKGNDEKQRERGNRLLEQRSGWVWGRSKGVLLLGGSCHRVSEYICVTGREHV